MFFSTGGRLTVATLPTGAFNIQFWFPFKEMGGNYLGNVTFVFSWCDISAYQHNEISFVYLKKRYFDSIEIYDKQGKVILASLYSGKFDTRNDPLVFAGTEWYFYFHTQFLHAKGPLKETCEIKVPTINDDAWSSQTCY